MSKEIESLQKYTPLIPWVIGGTVVGVLGLGAFYIFTKLKGLDPRTWFGDIPSWLEDLFPEVTPVPEFPAKNIDSTFKKLYDDSLVKLNSALYWEYYQEMDTQYGERFEWTTIRLVYKALGEKLDEEITARLQQRVELEEAYERAEEYQEEGGEIAPFGGGFEEEHLVPPLELLPLPPEPEPTIVLPEEVTGFVPEPVPFEGRIPPSPTGEEEPTGFEEEEEEEEPVSGGAARVR